MNIEKVIKNAEEIVTLEDLKSLEGKNLKGYIGFEPSGLVHLGTGLICGNKVKDLVESGINMRILLADWHAYINDKFGGDMEKIRLSAEIMKQSFLAIGVPESVDFVYADDLVDSKQYWEKIIKVAKNTTLNRVRRAMDIMGRKDTDMDLDSSKIIYPFMQVTDIFHMDLDIALGGMDQRHAHMLARELAPKLGFKKPVAIHTPLLTGLKGGNRMDFTSKMSKSKADSAIFVTDSPEKIKSKIKGAFCPEGDVENNPILDIYRYIIFPYYKNEIKIEKKYGGDIIVKNYRELEEFYSKREIHPLDLKENISEILIEILEPVRKHFNNHPELQEMINKIG
ncbi:MAG: tyrosine--tRNA ligase [Thermoplasmata archaeon]|nr:tyrosine--tRNA ligase [Thermoplasmata archaeon]